MSAWDDPAAHIRAVETERDRLREVVARATELADDLCDFHGGHGDFLTAGRSLRAALGSQP